MILYSMYSFVHITYIYLSEDIKKNVNYIFYFNPIKSIIYFYINWKCITVLAGRNKDLWLSKIKYKKDLLLCYKLRN